MDILFIWIMAFTGGLWVIVEWKMNYIESTVKRVLKEQFGSIPEFQWYIKDSNIVHITADLNSGIRIEQQIAI